MVVENAIILTMNHGDSLFLLKDPGIKMQRVNHGMLSDKVVIWIKKDSVKRKKPVIGYLFKGDDDNHIVYDYIIPTGGTHHYENLTCIRKDSLFSPLPMKDPITYSVLSSMSDKWEQYIFISKEEEK